MELERIICLWLKTAPIKEVAYMFQLSWDEVATIQEHAVKRGLQNRKLIQTKQIGVDETSFQKRHEYVTIILEKETDTVLDILQDRKAITLGTWFKTQETANFEGLQSVSMDMWDPFIKAIRDNFENADSIIAFDRYHVAQHFNKALDKIRAAEIAQFRLEFGSSLPARSKFEWLRNSSRTNSQTGRRPAFLTLIKMNLKTARAWRIKETVSQLWDYAYMGVAIK